MFGRFAVGTPDVTSHLAEEIPDPSVNIPKAMLAQYVFGFLSGLLFLIPLLYGISDLAAVQSSSSLFPLADIYVQVVGSTAGSIGLMSMLRERVTAGLSTVQLRVCLTYANQSLRGDSKRTRLPSARTSHCMRFFLPTRNDMLTLM